MKLSIVTTLFKSTEYIQEFYTRISIEAQKITQDYEIIFVDDGSPDNSLQKAVALFETDNRVKVIELSRNFGHHKAIMTGLNHASGEFVFLIDSDLEEDPELIGKFWEELNKKNQDFDIVYGVQKIRKGYLLERFSGWLFYKIFNFFSEVKIPENFLTIRLMKKNYVKNLISFKEKQIVLSVLTILNGFKAKEIIVVKKNLNTTTYSFFLKFRLTINSLVASSPKFLTLAFYSGLFITINSFLFVLYLIIKKLLFNAPVEGWVSIMASIFFFGGLIIIFLGVIGLYLSEIFYEVKNRPLTIIKKIHEKKISEKYL
jgi:putative glycosyltransferase